MLASPHQSMASPRRRTDILDEQSRGRLARWWLFVVGWSSSGLPLSWPWRLSSWRPSSPGASTCSDPRCLAIPRPQPQTDRRGRWSPRRRTRRRIRWSRRPRRRVRHLKSFRTREHCQRRKPRLKRPRRHATALENSLRRERWRSMPLRLGYRRRRPRKKSFDPRRRRRLGPRSYRARGRDPRGGLALPAMRRGTRSNSSRWWRCARIWRPGPLVASRVRYQPWQAPGWRRWSR